MARRRGMAGGDGGEPASNTGRTVMLRLCRQPSSACASSSAIERMRAREEGTETEAKAEETGPAGVATTVLAVANARDAIKEETREMLGWSRHRRLKLGQASEDKEEVSAEVELADKALREAPHVLHDRVSH
ncbi:hypothetical protein OsJ_31346 [Oryza sativa Japonica Group]|uniref:Uncharacterized protein n=2 Tax=Oryza sativa subsp. japonica TaxID=39947 RepID=A0A8J8YL98_ORYSJ|nr:hypothetical protein LOC_Os10g24880 [Oryza sativa Japonica Group]EAZ15923.1 hypothetical protein OsJ_31346 [Oryza sativa Japonica Group]